jgi:hypothetical protein
MFEVNFCILWLLKVSSIVQDGQIKETHAKLIFELEMHHEQISKDHSNYGILASLANENAQTSTHMMVDALHLSGHNVPIKRTLIVYYV